MNPVVDVPPRSAVVGLSPGTAIVFGEVPEGLSLIPFRLVPTDDLAEIVQAVDATSPVLRVGGKRFSEFTRPTGIVRLSSKTLDSWRGLITPPPCGDFLVWPWQDGSHTSQVRWLPAPENAPSVVLARLNLAAPMLAIQTRLHAVLGFSQEDTLLVDNALRDVRQREWADLWGLGPTVINTLHKALGAGDASAEVIDSYLMVNVVDHRQARDQLKLRVETLADKWDEVGPLPELMRLIEATGEAALLDLHSLLIAHKWWFVHHALRAARARISAREDPLDPVTLRDITSEMLDSHEETLKTVGRVLGSINFASANWHIRNADQPGYAGPKFERPPWDATRRQIDVATRKLADA